MGRFVRGPLNYRYLSPLRPLRISASLLLTRATRSGERVLCMWAATHAKIGEADLIHVRFTGLC